MKDRDGNEIRPGDPLDIPMFAPGYCEQKDARVGVVFPEAGRVAIWFADSSSCELAREQVVRR